MPEAAKNKKNIGAREDCDGSQKRHSASGAVNKEATVTKKQKLKHTGSLIEAPKDSTQNIAAASGSKAKKSEIDDLFGQLKGKKNVSVPPPSAAAEELNGKHSRGSQEVTKESDKQKTSKLEGNKDDIFGNNTGKARKRTEEGFKIYSEDEIGFGKRGGDTPQCPFDCDCCF